MKPLLAWSLSLAIVAFTWAVLWQISNFREVIPAEGNSLTIVLIDGLSGPLFREELAKGNLPVLESLMKKSLYVENGISAFPTMTGYGFYPFITGRDASESGIYGLRWFDKKRERGPLRNYVGRTNVQMNRDIAVQPSTFFELSGKLYTATINTYMNRGAAESIKTGFAHTTAKYEGKTWLTSLGSLPWIGRSFIKNHFQHETDVTRIALEQLDKMPKLQWITYASPDAYNHINGTDSLYQRLLRHIDHEIGRLLTKMAEPNHRHRALAIVSDHGIQDVDHNIDVCAALYQSTGMLMERGKSAVLYSTDLKLAASSLSHLDAYLVINGNLSAYIYTLHGSNSKTAARALENFTLHNGRKIDLPREVVKLNGIELCVYWDDRRQEAIVLHKDGKARIGNRKLTYSYTVEYGKDPLSYTSDPSLSAMVNMGYFPDSAWMQNTVNSKYPDAIFRLYKLMSREKSGDLLITSAEGYDLAKNYEAVVSNYKGGHGGATQNIILVPYIYYRPGEKASVTRVMRAEELGSMFKQYLFGKKD